MAERVLGSAKKSMEAICCIYCAQLGTCRGSYTGHCTCITYTYRRTDARTYTHAHMRTHMHVCTITQYIIPTCSCTRLQFHTIPYTSGHCWADSGNWWQLSGGPAAAHFWMLSAVHTNTHLYTSTTGRINTYTNMITLLLYARWINSHRWCLEDLTHRKKLRDRHTNTHARAYADLHEKGAYSMHWLIVTSQNIKFKFKFKSTLFRLNIYWGWHKHLNVFSFLKNTQVF